MAVADLNDLFESVDGLTEDLMEYGIIAGSAVAAHMAFNAAVAFGLSKWTTAPAWVASYAVPAAALVSGAVVGGFGSKYIGRKAATGVAVGLMTAGITRLVRAFAPVEMSAFLGASAEEVMMNGLGGDGAFNRYLGTAPTTVENIGRAPTSVENVSGLGSGYGSRLSAATVAAIS